MKGLPLLTRSEMKEKASSYRKGQGESRWRQIDFSRGDSGADDRASSYVALHKHLAAAEGSDRSKQGIFTNTSDR